MFDTILFPVDHSRESLDAADTVIDVVQKYNSRLFLLSVLVEDPEEGEAKDTTKMTSSEEVEKLLKGAQAMFAQKGIKTETIERQGLPAFTICDVADEVEAKLIVMGCRGIGLTEEGLAESVTNRVINLAPCPVLIVP
ncbi:MAG: universal stress protein [Okeania sp. SIO2D1]|nr:universal stress protein [Okeania sp. SIO2D1]